MRIGIDTINITNKMIGESSLSAKYAAKIPSPRLRKLLRTFSP